MAIENRHHRHLLAIAAPPLLLTLVLYLLHHTSSNIVPYNTRHIVQRDGEARCHVDITSPDACRLVAEKCADFDNDGLLPYLHLYACAIQPARPFLLVGLVLWLLVLFGSMAMVAAEFLAPHLEFIVQSVGISENLAGVTLFAFGNGCTDLFATLAAMEANSGSLAISELFGAAAFITTVVLGLITWIRPFTVDPRAFVGDVVWFIVAASLLTTFLADGELLIGECVGIIGLYIAYALFAILRPSSRINPAVPATTPVAGSRTDGRHDDHEDSAASHLLGELEETTSDAGSDNSLATNTADAETEFHTDIVQTSHAAHAGRNDDPNDNVDSFVSSQEPTESNMPPPPYERHASPNGSTPSIDRRSIWLNFPPVQTWSEQRIAERTLTVLSLPLLFPIGATTPPPPSTRRKATVSPVDDSTNRRASSLQFLAEHWFLCLQLILGPQLFALVVISQSMEDTETSYYLIACAAALFISVLLISYYYCSTRIGFDNLPGGELVLSISALVISLIWIYLTATSAVTLLMTLALILDIPTALLGATVFAIGQSSNDLVANTAVARRGMPVLAASATFGGPMMNMFLGIGGGGLIQVLKMQPHDGKRAYTFENASGVFVSAANLLLGLVVTLGYAFCNSWRLDRRLGIALIGIWVTFTVVNVAIGVAI